MKILAQTIEQLKVGVPSTFGGLTVYPLLGEDGPGPAVLTLEQAIENGQARVQEVSTAGEVVTLHLLNQADRPILLLDGEELVGAKQNRILNLTILAPAGKSLEVPVSCVEAGRWSSVSAHFATSPQVMHSTGRSQKAATVSASMARQAGARSDQAQVWSEVALLSRRYRVESATSKMSDVFLSQKKKLEDYVKAFSAQRDQRGVAFALRGRVRGVEFFDHHQTLESLLPKLIRSWALDTLSLNDQASEVPPTEAVHAMLERVVTSKITEHDGTGLGVDLRFSAEGLAGGCLVHQDRVVHLCAFTLEPGNGSGDGGGRSSDRMNPASRRRRRWL